jgi:cytochrome c oxidase assembly protein subunit 15
MHMDDRKPRPARVERAPDAGESPRARLWLHRYAVLVAACTGLLVFAGGLVTSTGSGLAVPDWPLSYGELMPPMVGNVRFEHGHRMLATGVGMLTIGLVAWLWKRDPRRWMRRLGLAALGAVIAQGLLGGLTVLLLLPAPISVAHGTLGQTFFCIVVGLALFTSPGWRTPAVGRADRGTGPSLRGLATLLTGAVFVQLLLGAAMRHTEAGLAIPDFPLAFGRLVPPFDRPGVAIAFAHRVGATVVFFLAAWTVARTLGAHREEGALARPAILLAALVVAQVLLGATTVWTGKAPLPTTFHVLGGAGVLATSLVLALRARKHLAPRPYQPVLEPQPVGAPAR